MDSSGSGIRGDPDRVDHRELPVDPRGDVQPGEEPENGMRIAASFKLQVLLVRL